MLSAKGRDLGPEMHDSPPYLMPNWNEAEQSVVHTGRSGARACDHRSWLSVTVRKPACASPRTCQ
ncbi:conserved hypothetical protein [Agrobacterium fabacearum S56]|nr:conserved hypothetical protein [Agrobacterium fabacearum S56]